MPRPSPASPVAARPGRTGRSHAHTSASIDANQAPWSARIHGIWPAACSTPPRARSARSFRADVRNSRSRSTPTPATIPVNARREDVEGLGKGDRITGSEVG
jgi:hypothetical protein